MLVFDYMIRLYNQVVSAEVAPVVEWRGPAEDIARVGSTAVVDSIGAGSAVDSARARSAHSWKGRTGRIVVRNCLSSMKDKVADVVGDKRNECWWGQWWMLTLGHESEYDIVCGLWSSSPAKGVANPAGIQWVEQKWKGQTLQKLYSSIRSISRSAEVEGE
jgi:hypothetical protein